jgi:hypothetical protein
MTSVGTRWPTSCTESLDDVGAAPSIGTIGDSYDCAMAESEMRPVGGELGSVVHAKKAVPLLWRPRRRASNRSSAAGHELTHNYPRRTATSSSAKVQSPKWARQEYSFRT